MLRHITAANRYPGSTGSNVTSAERPGQLASRWALACPSQVQGHRFLSGHRSSRLHAVRMRECTHAHTQAHIYQHAQTLLYSKTKNNEG